MSSMSRHQCLIYTGSPLQQLPALAVMIQQKLGENYRCLYLNSPAMVAEMRSCLAAAGINVEHEVAENNLLLSSEAAIAADGSFDTDLMMRKLEDALDQSLKDGHAGLFATGDMSWEFGCSKDSDSFSKLLEYEWRLEKLFRKRRELHGICQYHNDTLPIEAMRKGFLGHQAIFINATLSCINQYYTQPGSITEQAAAQSDVDEAISDLLKKG